MTRVCPTAAAVPNASILSYIGTKYDVANYTYTCMQRSREGVGGLNQRAQKKKKRGSHKNHIKGGGGGGGGGNPAVAKYVQLISQAHAIDDNNSSALYPTILGWLLGGQNSLGKSLEILTPFPKSNPSTATLHSEFDKEAIT
ncbi:hypothetical protein J3459_007704 [Metarhizium acridum]|nr:hypothetical protein J3459_007704 [Metarhizium acridum]